MGQIWSAIVMPVVSVMTTRQNAYIGTGRMQTQLTTGIVFVRIYLGASCQPTFCRMIGIKNAALLTTLPLVAKADSNLRSVGASVVPPQSVW